jgi:effector-binding domain-containing protein
MKKVLIGIAAFILLIIGFAYVLPRNVLVERSIIINASEEAVFEQINTMKNWETWSPWHKIDPNMKIEYFGPEKGQGAGYTWDSENPDAGKGKLALSVSEPYSRITTEMDFMEKGTGSADFTFEKTENGIKLIWSMNADMGNNPIGRIFGLFMDKMLGDDFEEGLKGIKEAAEATAKWSYDIKVMEVPSFKAISIIDSVSASSKADIGPVLSAKLGQLYGELVTFMVTNQLNQPDAPVFAIYHSWTGTSTVLEAGIPIDSEVKGNNRVNFINTYAGKAIVCKHYGPYENTEKAHYEIDEWAKANDVEIAGAPWEVYVTDPGQEKDSSKWLTEIYYPVK